MNLKDIRELIEILKDSDVSEFELDRSGVRIRVKKAGQAHQMVMVESPGAELARGPAPGVPVPAIHPAPEAASVAAEGEAPPGTVVVNSPIVGTFYRSPSPESPSYVEVGDVVKKGQVLCIIEAMKLMNEIEAEVSGKIVKIIPENAQPVEFAEPLFHIEQA